MTRMMAVSGHDLVTVHWNGLELRSGDYRYNECQAVLRSINLEDLANHASNLKSGQLCRVEPQFAKAGRNVVRMLNFDDGKRWIARFRMANTFTSGQSEYGPEDDSILVREVHCLQLIAQRTSVPVPKVFDYGTSKGPFGIPYILMECLPGSCAIDVDRFIPEQFKKTFYKQMAYMQVQITNLTFPKIGTIILRNDGSVDIGPIPGIGGPFSSAHEYLRAWAETAKFYSTEDDVRNSCGPFSDEVWNSIVDFPQGLYRLADQICEGDLDHGPFPLFHPDFGHQNMIVDADYDILGVIDWEHAASMPWQALTLPYTLSTTPPPMCPPQWYDKDGQPVDEDLQVKHGEIEAYIKELELAETQLQVNPRLSRGLRDQKVQNVAVAMDLYLHHGKMGFYSKTLEPFNN